MKVIPARIIKSCMECPELTDWDVCAKLQREIKHPSDGDIPKDCPLLDDKSQMKQRFGNVHIEFDSNDRVMAVRMGDFYLWSAKNGLDTTDAETYWAEKHRREGWRDPDGN